MPRDPDSFTDPGLSDDDHVSMPQGQLKDWQKEFDLLRSFVWTVTSAGEALKYGLEQWYEKGEGDA